MNKIAESIISTRLIIRNAVLHHVRDAGWHYIYNSTEYHEMNSGKIGYGVVWDFVKNYVWMTMYNKLKEL